MRSPTGVEMREGAGALTHHPGTHCRVQSITPSGPSQVSVVGVVLGSVGPSNRKCMLCYFAFMLCRRLSGKIRSASERNLRPEMAMVCTRTQTVYTACTHAYATRGRKP